MRVESACPAGAWQLGPTLNRPAPAAGYLTAVAKTVRDGFKPTRGGIRRRGGRMKHGGFAPDTTSVIGSVRVLGHEVEQTNRSYEFAL